MMGFYFHKLSKGDSSVHVSFFIETVSQVSDVTHGSLVVVNYKNHPVSTWRSSCSVSEQVNRIPEITCYNLIGNWNGIFCRQERAFPINGFDCDLKAT